MKAATSTPATAPASEPRCESAPLAASKFRVVVEGAGALRVEPWFVKDLPAPARIADLAPWVKEGPEREPPRPDELYTLELAEAASLLDFANATTVFSSRGFVHGVALAGNAQAAFFADYTPPESASSSNADSIPSLNLTLDEQHLFVTTVLTARSMESSTLDDRSFDRASGANADCQGQLANFLLRVCAHPAKPCDRVALVAQRDAPVGDLIRTLSLLGKLLPGHAPVVVEVMKGTSDSAREHRDQGAPELLVPLIH